MTGGDEEEVKPEKEKVFVRHIEEHLEKMFPNLDARVCCKICGKDIDTIYKEDSKKRSFLGGK